MIGTRQVWSRQHRREGDNEMGWRIRKKKKAAKVCQSTKPAWQVESAGAELEVNSSMEVGLP